MGKQKTTDGKPKPEPAAHTEARLEALLERFDQALLSGDQTQIDDITEQFWPIRRHIPEVLTKRITDGRARVPTIAFEMLAGFAGQRTKSYLKRIAEDRNAPDIVRFGAQRRAGWPQRGEKKRRLAFLETLKEAEGTLLEAVNQGTHTWPPEADILAEVLGYLIVVPDERRQALVKQIAAEFGLRAAWLLHAALHIPDPGTQRLTLSELVRLPDLGAIGSIGRLEITTQNSEILTEAESAARRLRMRVANRSNRPTTRPFPPVERALLSMIDGEGAQAILLARNWESGVFLTVDILHNDHWGIKDTFGWTHMPADEFKEMLAELEEQEVYMVDVDLATVRGVLSAAVEVNAATGHDIPSTFELWEPLLHDSYPPSEDEPIIAPELDDAPYADRKDLIRSSDQLLNHRFFETWSFDLAETSLAMAAAPPPRGNRLTDRQYRPIIQLLAHPSSARVQLRRRLRRQARLLDQSGDPHARDLALAVAAQLNRGTLEELVKQPFLRAMVQSSVIEVVTSILSLD